MINYITGGKKTDIGLPSTGVSLHCVETRDHRCSKYLYYLYALDTHFSLALSLRKKKEPQPRGF